MLLSNDCAYLKFYKESLKGTVQDYCISFYSEQDDFSFIINKTKTLFEKLVDNFSHAKLKARLVAKLNFSHFNSEKDMTEERSYHFPSYTAEEVVDPKTFFIRHMLKICSQLDNFNSRGSNLLLQNIEHIHILLTLL